MFDTAFETQSVQNDTASSPLMAEYQRVKTEIIKLRTTPTGQALFYKTMSAMLLGSIIAYTAVRNMPNNGVIGYLTDQKEQINHPVIAKPRSALANFILGGTGR